MTQSVLQINFNFTSSRAEYEAANVPNAAPIAAMPGLNWKIWLMNEAESEGGGIYLFEDEATCQEFARQAEGMLTAPAFTNLSIKRFEPIEALSAITRGPLAPAPRPKTFGDMAAEALAAIPTIKPAALKEQLEHHPGTLLIDVRDAADISQTGTIPGAVNISYGSLTYMADNHVPESWRDPRLADRSRPIVTTCILGPLGALGGKLLHDMGFSDVKILEGGVQSWIDAGLAVSGEDSA